jgi:hypothetical protein
MTIETITKETIDYPAIVARLNADWGLIVRRLASMTSPPPKSPPRKRQNGRAECPAPRRAFVRSQSDEVVIAPPRKRTSGLRKWRSAH